MIEEQWRRTSTAIFDTAKRWIPTALIVGVGANSQGIIPNAERALRFCLKGSVH